MLFSFFFSFVQGLKTFFDFFGVHSSHSNVKASLVQADRLTDPVCFVYLSSRQHLFNDEFFYIYDLFFARINKKTMLEQFMLFD